MTRKINIPDLVLAAIVIVGGISTIVYASGMKRLNTGQMGPGLFPTLIGGLLILFGTILLIQSVRRVDQSVTAVDGETDLETPPALSETGEGGTFEIEHEKKSRLIINGLVVVGGIIAYILLVEHLGFVLTLFLILSAIMISLREVWWKALIFAAVVTAIMYLGFEKGLMVQLPNRFVEF